MDETTQSADPQTAGAPAPLSAEEERRQRLKAAGEAYFAKVLNQSKGKDLLSVARLAGAGAGGAAAVGGSNGSGTGGAAAAPRLPLTTFDEDFLQAGAVIEGARTYVLGTIFVAAQAVQLVFLKSSLDALHAPALMLFLHFLPVALTLWLLAAQGVLELRRPSLRVVQGSLVPALLSGLQALLLFWAVLHSSVFLVLCWTVTSPHVLRAALDAATSQRLPPQGRLAGLGLSLACTVSALLVQFPSMKGLLALLCWAVTEVAAAAWAQLRQQPELLQPLVASQPALSFQLQQLAEAEAGLDSASLALMRHTLPLLPALLLGLLLREGSELVDHELSVPAVTVILLSCLAMTASTACDLLMSGGLTRVAHEALVAAGPLGAVVTETAVHGLSSPIAFVAAIACSLAGMLLRVTAAAAVAS